MNKAIEVLKRELNHVEYLLDPKTGYVLTSVDDLDARDGKVALKEDVQDDENWNPAFWESGELDDKLQVGMIVAGEWWDGGLFKIEEAYTLDELKDLQRHLSAALTDLQAPRFIEIRQTGGQPLPPVIVRDLKEAVLAIHEEMDERFDPGSDAVSIYGESGELAYQYTPEQELRRSGLAEYLAASGCEVVVQPDTGPAGYSPAAGPLVKIFPLS